MALHRLQHNKLTMKDDGGGATAGWTADVDTEPPFRSVKEAVSLFGETVLAGDFRTRRLKQTMPCASSNSHGGSELEETKRSLEKALEESGRMANQVHYLKQELENAREELRELKMQKKPSTLMMKDLREIELDEESVILEDEEDEDEEVEEFQKRRYVTFTHPSLSQIILPEGNLGFEKEGCVKKKKKAFVLPLIGGMFPKRKGKFGV